MQIPFHPIERYWARVVCVAGLLVALTGCGNESTEPVPDPVESPIDSEEALLDELALAYREFDFDRFAAVLSDATDAEFLFLYTTLDGDPVEWGLEEMLRIHHRLFEPSNVSGPRQASWRRTSFLALPLGRPGPLFGPRFVLPRDGLTRDHFLPARFSESTDDQAVVHRLFPDDQGSWE